MKSAPIDPARLFSLTDPAEREALTHALFAFQFAQNPVYRAFCQALDRHPDTIRGIDDIPFLPIRFFREQQVVSFKGSPEVIFESSGTTGSIASRHMVYDSELYAQSYLEGFRRIYGDPASWCIMALLPGYLERSSSSLVHMVKGLIDRSGHPESGFYLDDLQGLSEKLRLLNAEKQAVWLIGVSFALLDLAEYHPQPLPHTIIIETGGMKGRRRELLRSELHDRLSSAFSVRDIHSEYGMTELLSQAYAPFGGYFHCPPWMQVLIRDQHDPFGFLPAGQTGGINVIDLANIWSCSFIATDDLGRLRGDGSFEVLGRLDYSQLRGCNLMVSND